MASVDEASTLTVSDFVSARIEEDRVARPQACDPVHWAAMRLILTDLDTFKRVRDMRPNGTPYSEALTIAGHIAGLEHALRRLALIWSNHPDWQPEWRNP
jgi:hypothetical protein